MSITWNAAPAPAPASTAAATTVTTPATPPVAAPFTPLPPAVAPARVPLLAQPRVQRVLLLAAWQAAVTLWEVPVYIVPSPTRILATLWDDRALLAAALGVTAICHSATSTTPTSSG